VAVSVAPYRGWVFDASTVGGAFTASGIVVKNCRRVTTPRADLETAADADRARRQEGTSRADVSAVQAQAARQAKRAAQALPRTAQLRDRVARAADGRLLPAADATVSSAQRNGAAGRALATGEAPALARARRLAAG